MVSEKWKEMCCDWLFRSHFFNKWDLQKAFLLFPPAMSEDKWKPMYL